MRRLGDRLAKEGYRGFFEVDVLVDTDSGDVYLGELNPRISGASSITNVTAGAYADIPLFLFHILEYMNVDFDLDVDEINDRWEELASEDVWSQMVMKETDEIVQQLTATPRTGQYSLDGSGALVFRRAALDWHQLQNEAEAFFLRIYGPGDYRWKGADLGVVVTKGRLQVDSGAGKSALAIRAGHLIDSIRADFTGTPIAEPDATGECRPQIPAELGSSGTESRGGIFDRRRSRPRSVGTDTGQLAVGRTSALDLPAHRRVPADRADLPRRRTGRRAAVRDSPSSTVSHYDPSTASAKRSGM